jgi:SWIM zinc finger
VRLDLNYLGHSEVTQGPSGSSLSFAPNLARPRVFFDAELQKPLRFREAMSALHDVVVGDLRFEKKNKTAYEAWKKQQAEDEAELRRTLTDQAKMRELAKIAKEPLPRDLEGDFRRLHKQYWGARVRWANELARNDPELFRHLVPCDPVVTVAPDVVFFECFSKDESAYGCLAVDRNAMSHGEAGLGTTNVDYSIALYEHFQTLRSYRPTRLLVDPTGFEVKVEGREDYREEKIDLPPSWLRGFGQLQAAMTLPSRKIEVPVEAVYSILAHLKRNREKTGPRSLRFRLTPGKTPVIVLDPWGIEIACRGPAIEDEGEITAPTAGKGPYRSSPIRVTTRVTEEIKVWGRRRLFSLARILPLVERIEVRLLGSGLPSIWIAHLGEMRFILALSGWTANDWTSGGSLEMLAASARVDARVTTNALHRLEQDQVATIGALSESIGTSPAALLPSLHELAKQGQVIYDFGVDAYRYRQVMPVALSEAVLGPEHPELVAGKKIAQEKKVHVLREEALPGGKRLYVFKAQETSAEAVVDADGAFKKAKCSCSFFFKSRLRAGPCRHLIALKLAVLDTAPPPPPAPPVAVAVAVAGPPPVPPSVSASSSPAAPAKRGPARREEVVSFTRAVLDEIKTHADTTDRGLSEVVEEAWDLVFQRILTVPSWKEALKLCDPARAKAIQFRSVESPEQLSLLLHLDVLREIALVADQLAASPSAVVNLAWLIARRKP